MSNLVVKKHLLQSLPESVIVNSIGPLEINFVEHMESIHKWISSYLQPWSILKCSNARYSVIDVTTQLQIVRESWSFFAEVCERDCHCGVALKHPLMGCASLPNSINFSSRLLIAKISNRYPHSPLVDGV